MFGQKNGFLAEFSLPYPSPQGADEVSIVMQVGQLLARGHQNVPLTEVPSRKEREVLDTGPARDG